MKATQLDMMGVLYKNEEREGEFLKELMRKIRDLKYLRAKIEGVQSFKDPNSDEFLGYSEASSSIGYVLYYLAILGYYSSREHPKYKDKDVEWFHEKTYDFFPVNPELGYNKWKLRVMTGNTRKSLESFITTHQEAIDKEPIYNRIVSEMLESMDNVFDSLP